MHEENVVKVQETIAAWEYMNTLPAEKYGYTLYKDMKADELYFDIYSYRNNAAHKAIVVFYQEETDEYKVRLKLGLIEFCLIEFITADINKLESLLNLYFDDHLKNLAIYNEDNISMLVKGTGVFDWEYGKNLPAELEGFALFSKTTEPRPVDNGSYIIFDYSDFSIESNFVAYYNIFRNEFYCEYILKGQPTVTYDFDSDNIDGLEASLRHSMVDYLKLIRKSVMSGD